MFLSILLTTLFALGVSSSLDHTPIEQNIRNTDNIAESTSNDTMLLKSNCYYKLEYNYSTGSPVTYLPDNDITFAEYLFVNCSNFVRSQFSTHSLPPELAYSSNSWKFYVSIFVYQIYFTESFTFYFRPLEDTTFNISTFTTITEITRTKGVYYLDTLNYYTSDYLDFSSFVINPITNDTSICIWGDINPLFDNSTFLMYGSDNKLFPRNESTYETTNKITYYSEVCYFEPLSSPYNNLRPSFYATNEYGIVPVSVSPLYTLKYSCFEVQSSLQFHNIFQAYILDQVFTTDYDSTKFKKLNNGWWYFNLSRFNVSSYNGFNFVGSFVANNNTYKSLYFDIVTIDTMDLYFTYNDYVLSNNIYTYQTVNTNLVHNLNSTWTTYNPRTFNCLCYFNYDIVPLDAYNNFTLFATPQFVVEDPTTTEFTDLFFALADTPIYYLVQLLSFDLFGINLYVAFTSIIALLLVLWIIKKFI